MKKYTLLILLAMLGACSTDEVEEVADVPALQETSVRFKATVGTNGYEDYFEQDDQIRIYCPIGYSTPDFRDGAKGMFIYEWKHTKEDAATQNWENWPYVFKPVGGSGFDWRTLQPTSIYYTFEAMHFPGKEYLESVPSDQGRISTPGQLGGLETADMLIAHHRQVVTEKGQAVKLTFHHAFAMVEVTVKLPVSATPLDGPFPPDALQGVYMNDMQTHYTVTYSGTITNDALRTVRATGETRERIEMRRIESVPETRETDEDGDETHYQTYVYRGIVPEQEFKNDGQDFLFFRVKRHSHELDGEEEVLYKFTIGGEDDKFSLKSSKILSLTLEIKEALNKVVVVSAKVMPWGRAEADMELNPKD